MTVPARPTLDEAWPEGPRALLPILGPGIVTGATDDDPSASGPLSRGLMRIGAVGNGTGGGRGAGQPRQRPS
jgi:hypothetical protein